MLYWIWSVVLLSVGSLLVYRDALNDRLGVTFVGMVLQIAALFLVADLTIVPAYRWLCSMLPNQGEAINFITSGVLIFGLFAAGLVCNCTLLHALGEKKRKATSRPCGRPSRPIVGRGEPD